MVQKHMSGAGNGITIPEHSRSGRRLQNHERMMILAKSIFFKQKTPAYLEKKEFPSVLLEAEQWDEGLPNFPEEILYLLQSIKYATTLGRLFYSTDIKFVSFSVALLCKLYVMMCSDFMEKTKLGNKQINAYSHFCELRHRGVSSRDRSHY